MLFAGFALVLLAVTATVFACGWMGTEHSVRFNSWDSEREMGRLPPLPTLANGKTEASAVRVYEDELEWEEAEKGRQERTLEIDGLWTQAEEAEARADLRTERELLRRYLDLTAVARDTRDTRTDVTDRQQRRNSAIDRLDALSALDKGSTPAAVGAYLAARRAYDSLQSKNTDDGARATVAATPHADDVEGHDSALGVGAEEPPDEDAESPVKVVRRALDAASGDNNLEDNVAYLRAAVLLGEDNEAEAARAFNALAARFHQSEKREAALFMAALVRMKMSKSYTGTSGDEAHLDARYSTEKDSKEMPTAIEPPDQAWHAARDGFMRVLSEYPRGRYNGDARGWLAYLLLRANDRAGALVEYYRLLGDEREENARIEAAFSLSLVRHHASDEEMRRVEAQLADEPAAALAYAYHNVYNYSIDPGCPLGAYYFDYGSKDWEAQRAAAKRDDLKRTEKERIVEFATRMLSRYPRAAVGGGFALRLAGANLELDNNRAALEQAVRALGLGVQREERARALWVKGVAEHRLRQFAAARETLGKLFTEDPHGRLTEGARRLVAMAAEDAGDLDAALEQYLALDYTLDVAYFVDVLMTPEQLSAFIARHADLPRRDELLYSLGIRYLRRGRYADARAAYAQVSTKNVEPDADDYSFDDYDSCDGWRRCSPKNPRFSASAKPGVRARWVLHDLQVAEDLERLERDAATTTGDEARAEALYQLASYIYESSTLLFYNPAMWRSSRYRNLSYLHSSDRYRAPNEARILWEYMQEHDTLARSLVIYLQAARDYPKTRAARDALYTAAVCHDRLSKFNPYWRDAYEIGLHAGDRLVTYEDVQRTYPNYQLPRGTDGWQPRTRTVDGGPGWAAPPPPRPRPTKWQRAGRKLERARELAGRVWEEHARRPLLVSLSVMCVAFAFFLTRRARRLLRAQLAARGLPDSQQAAARRELASTFAEADRHSLSAKLRLLSRHARRETWRLMHDARGRTTLALNLVTHGLLTVLLWVLARVLRGGG